MLEVVILQCQIILYRLSDMKDWYAIMHGQFRKRTTGFNLNSSITKIIKVMTQKAMQRNIKLVIFSPFSTEGFLVGQIHYQSFIENLKKTHDHESSDALARPLFKRIAENYRKETIP